jgi:hypothetical protein
MVLIAIPAQSSSGAKHAIMLAARGERGSDKNAGLHACGWCDAE